MDKQTPSESSSWPYVASSLWLMMCACLLGTGCNLSQWRNNGFKVGPDYCPPAAEVSENWIDADDPRVVDLPPDYTQWWSVFGDPVLDELVAIADQQNLTLREAGFRVLQARAQRAIAAGERFPQVQQIDGSYTREQIGVQQQPYLVPIPGLFSRAFDAWSLSGNLSWEVDIWGRFRRAIESADASLDASIHDYDAIRVCLIAEVVAAYTDIRVFERRLEFARQNVKIQEGSLELAQAKADAGKTGDVSVYLSKSNLNETNAIIQPLEIGLRQANNRLCTLLGVSTVDLGEVLGQGNGIPTAGAEVAVGIPADLLRRRPDVRTAERQVAAQSAVIGIATADLYPRIAISGQISWSSENFSDLFESLSQGGGVGPSFQWDVLNYGRIRNNISVQEQRLNELVATYQNTVLTANQEVEDALVAFLKTQEQVTYLKQTVEATERALELEQINFKEGEIGFTGVFVLQGDLASKQDQLAAAQGQITTSLIAVYKALGGGWDAQCNCPDSLAEANFASSDSEAPIEVAAALVPSGKQDEISKAASRAGFLRQAFSRNAPSQMK